MGKRWKTGAQVGATYIGAVMGAGFASGQELLQFFVVYGMPGLYGVGFAAILFALFGMAVLYLVDRLRIHSYQELLQHLFAPWLGRAFDALLSLSLLLSLCVMLAGSGALWAEHLGTSRWTGIGITALGVLLVLLGQIRGIVLINSVLVPVKLAVCLIVAALAIGEPHGGDATLPASAPLPLIGGMWPLSSLLYVSFNLSLAAVVLTALGPHLAREGRWIGGILGGLGLGVFALAISGAMLQYYPQVTAYQVPMVYLAGRFHPYLESAYILILWLAMLTAAIGSAYGFAQRLAVKTGLSLSGMTVVSLLLVLPFIRYRFSDLVGVLYPLFGILGLPLMGALAWWLLKDLGGRIIFRK